MSDTQERIILASTSVNEQGEFEILAITAGEGNGWKFSAAALNESVSLWDGVHTFIDHHWFGSSVHDLAGVCHSPQWDEKAQGIKLRLKPFGPAAGVLTEMGKQFLAEEQVKPDVGFSADIMFTAKGKEVQQITRVFSVDLVVNPARGGEFVREIYQKLQKEENMPESKESLDQNADYRTGNPPNRGESTAKDRNRQESGRCPHQNSGAHVGTGRRS